MRVSNEGRELGWGAVGSELGGGVGGEHGASEFRASSLLEWNGMEMEAWKGIARAGDYAGFIKLAVGMGIFCRRPMARSDLKLRNKNIIRN